MKVFGVRSWYCDVKESEKRGKGRQLFWELSNEKRCLLVRCSMKPVLFLFLVVSVCFCVFVLAEKGG